jgi:hypothetical protein
MTAVTGQNVPPPITGSRRELPAALLRLVRGDVSESAWVRPAQIAVTLVAAASDHTRVGRATSRHPVQRKESP